MSAPTVKDPLPRLPDIHEVRPVGDRDRECIAELRSVLEKHQALGRFGITLLHQHFDLAPDEVLVEVVDVENRVLVSAPQVVSGVGSAVETSWRLDDPTGMSRCETVCALKTDWLGHPYHKRMHGRG
ncbi:MAG: hypothetical protein HOV94_02500 [Saccharothrix sp.]|nr:hypothetical protein [Saccharothrix sp.]